MKILKIQKALILLIIAIFAFGFAEGGDKNKTRLNKISSIEGTAYRMFINNVDLPMNNEGVIADVNIDSRAGGQLDGKVFLYSSGFYLSGISKDESGMYTLPWVNSVASASRIQDYLPGTALSQNDPKALIYVLRSKEGDFAESWSEWKDAVALGAYFWDGDGNGVYDPIDLNSNGKWDRSEDRPDLIGDETAWCVYTDAVKSALRSFKDIDPQGINIRQSVFAFSSRGVVGNMVFVRYSIENSGIVSDTIKDCYFTVWADPDLGGTTNGPYDDLVGSDTLLNAGYVYNNGDDEDWGINPPCFLIDFFQGPVEYIPGVTFQDLDGDGIFNNNDLPLDTATNVQGQVRGVNYIPGAKNLGLSSFMHYMQSHPTVGDPSISKDGRNYQLGLDKQGNPIDPCDWEYGTVTGVNCGDVNPKFLYSGNPIAQVGWINSFETDQRMMSNTGPFTLVKNQPLDIVVAYVVGRGEDALSSVKKAKDYDTTAQFIFDQNFPSPPAPAPVVLTSRNGNGFIDLTFHTSEQVNYNAIDTVLDIDRRLQGFVVNAFRVNSKEPNINGVKNLTKIAEYQVDNFIQNIFQLAPNGGIDRKYTNVTSNFKLNPEVYKDPTNGIIRVRISSDPFTGEPLVKGHQYYFSVIQYHLNHKAIVPKTAGLVYGDVDDYYDPTAGAIDEYETANWVVTYGEDQYDPSYAGMFGEQTDGASDGDVSVLTVIPEELTGDNYSVEFFKDNNLLSGENYSAFWRLKNITKNTTLIDSSKVYDFDTLSYGGKAYDGFLVKVKPVTPVINGLEDQGIYSPEENIWYSEFRTDSSTGVYYVGTDLPQGSTVKVAGNDVARSTVIKADKLRKIEIRFGDNGKAYRYLNGFKGTAVTRRSSYVYASYVTAAETLGTSIGKFGEGFVDVPFTAWVVDEKYQESKQLAVGFIEVSKSLGGTPDGIWDPGTTSTVFGNEIIAIFDAAYDANGNQIEFTGGASTVPADILKGFINGDSNATDEQKKVSQSPWFNAMYTVSLKRQYPSSWFTTGDKLTIPLSTYPYTDLDRFEFKTIAKGDLTFDQKKALFEKVNVFPNPLFGYNPATSYNNGSPDQPFITFSNLPEDVTVKIFTLSGNLIRTLGVSDKSSPQSTFIEWNLKNENGLRAASGLYLAIISSPEFGDKILKFSIIVPQKQIGAY